MFILKKKLINIITNKNKCDNYFYVLFDENNYT